ncbi:hypothetical protein [Planococcus halocryophilus]|uniref:hypothetical protein n=1 Tax=Planococcus halocryophilus TaxID=1215089 RepID=UPI001F0F6C92|nr:hypothetical protein [Planococcus halocryophilus]MCH4828162.1 hypothetical protein [Planococcus halocryophilus]
MKRIMSILVVVTVFTLLWNSSNAQAACDGVWVIEDETQMELTISKELTELTDISNETNKSIIEPMCGGGTLPPGWSGVRSKATLNNTTSSGKKIYHNNKGGAKAASADFNKIAIGTTTTKYVNTDGSVTLVKRSVKGDVRFYKSSSGNNPTIWWNNEKIRYLGLD